MTESFMAAVRVVLPMAILMALGVLVREKGVIDRPAMLQFDRLVFRLFMPVMLFKNVYETDISQGAGWREMVFSAASLAVIFTIALLLPRRVVKDGGKAAAIGQALVRSNYILFGIAVAEGLYGEGNIGVVPLLGAFVVPLTNALGVIILELNRSGRASPGRLLLSILKNPMVIATLAAFAVKACPVGIPGPIWSVIRSLAGATTTVSFISLGVGLDLNEARADLRPLMWGLGLRMALVPLLSLPLSVMLGFRGTSLCALMVLFAAPTAVASYPMAVAMGADGPLAGQLVCATTFLSLPTMFLYTFVFRGMGLL